MCEARAIQQWPRGQPVASGGALNSTFESPQPVEVPRTMSPAALGSRPGGTKAPLAYVFRALGLLEVHRRGRRKAAA